VVRARSRPTRWAHALARRLALLSLAAHLPSGCAIVGGEVGAGGEDAIDGPSDGGSDGDGPAGGEPGAPSDDDACPDDVAPAPDAPADTVLALEGSDLSTRAEQPLVASPFASTPGALIVYLAPDGDDAADGRSRHAAVRTLTRAHEIVAAGAAGRDVEVRVAAGRYQALSVRWTYTQPDHTIRILPDRCATSKPIFDGCTAWDVTDPATQCTTELFFVLDSRTGRPSNVYLENLHVQRYRQPITFRGDKVDETLGNGRNHVFGCFFYNIGDAYNPALDRGEACISIAGSDDNVIERSTFDRIRNADDADQRFLHVVYMNGHSDRNVVRDNRIRLGGGSPFRVRQLSHLNRLEHNDFAATSTEAIASDWHDVDECPSFGTVIRDNYVDGTYDCTTQPLNWSTSMPDVEAGCTAPAGVPRRTTSGRTTSSAPCSGEARP
jgi:hypothetical protein